MASTRKQLRKTSLLITLASGANAKPKLRASGAASDLKKEATEMLLGGKIEEALIFRNGQVWFHKTLTKPATLEERLAEAEAAAAEPGPEPEPEPEAAEVEADDADIDSPASTA